MTFLLGIAAKLVGEKFAGLALAGFAIVALVVFVGGAVVWIRHDAYTDGVRDRDRAAVAAIAKQKKAVIADDERHRAMTPDQLDAELRRKCREQGGTEEQCGKE